MGDLGKWHETRKMGMWKFIFLYGVLLWGVMTAVIYSIIMYFWTHPEPWYSVFISSIIIFPLVGVVWGLIMWKTSEKKYKKTKGK